MDEPASTLAPSDEKTHIYRVATQVSPDTRSLPSARAKASAAATNRFCEAANLPVRLDSLNALKTGFKAFLAPSERFWRVSFSSSFADALILGVCLSVVILTWMGVI